MHAQFDPFTELDRLQREFDEVARATRADEVDRARPAPAIDVYEQDGVVIVVAELPGVKAQDVRVHIDGDRVTLSGKRSRLQVERAPVERCFRLEMSCGAFRRSFTLPCKVDATRGESKLEEGILTLRLPRGA